MVAAGVKLEPAERSAKAHALAGTLFSLLDRWIDHGMKADPKEMDVLFHLFHRRAWNGLAGRWRHVSQSMPGLSLRFFSPSPDRAPV